MEQSNTFGQSMLLHSSSQNYSLRASMYIPRKTSWETPITPPSIQQSTGQAREEPALDKVNLGTSPTASVASDCEEPSLNNIATLGLSFTEDSAQVPHIKISERFSLSNSDSDPKSRQPLPPVALFPFDAWVKKIHRKATKKRGASSCDLSDSPTEWNQFNPHLLHDGYGHRKSGSGSSYGFVSAVKSASISLASFSIAPRSRRTTGVSSRQNIHERSVRGSNSGPRFSDDSSCAQPSPGNDQAVMQRLIQRRRVLEEIISTEESYIADVKFLMNVRF